MNRKTVYRGEISRRLYAHAGSLDGTEYAEIEISIDYPELLRHLGAKAQKSLRGTSRIWNGVVVAKVLNRRTVKT